MTIEREEKIIASIITALGTYNLGDIKNSRKVHEPPISINIMLATFILCSCFIDHMAQIRYFDINKFQRRKPYLTNHFTRFVKKYFNSKYDPKLLYDSLRSRLVHNYSVNGKYWLSDGEEYKHLQKIQGRIYLNLDSFIRDIEIAWNAFKKDLLDDPITRKHAIDHESVYPILKEGNLN